MKLWPFIALVGSLNAQPALPTIVMKWDYASTNPPATYTLLWGTNQLPAGTNLTASVSNALPNTYSFRASASNAGGSATSTPPVVVRVVRVNLETGPSPSGPWTGKTAIYDMATVGPSNLFFRARLDIQ